MLPIPIVVTLALLREGVRALLFPLWTLAYLCVRRGVQRRAAEVLASNSGYDDDDTLATFVRAHPPAKDRAPHLFLSAGEVSGETHAARVLRALQAGASAPVRTTCFGGDTLQAAGGNVVVPLSGHAIMGLGGVLRALPFILRTFATFLRVLREDRPSLVVLVDYPGFHLVMAAAARRHGVPVVHYIAPQYWAWAPWRMRRYRRCVDLCLAILPFEPALFRSNGVDCTYVGHPSLDQLAAAPPDPAHVARERASPTLCLLPGSRRRELDLHLGGMLGVVRRLRVADPDLRVVIAHRDAAREPLLREFLAREGATDIEFELGHVTEKLAGAQVVLAKSGTGSLEAALLGTPTVVVYRLPPFFVFLKGVLLNVPFFAVANLIAGRAVVPERCFADDAGWEWAANEVQKLFRLGPDRLACLDRLADVQHRLGEPGASERVAAFLVEALGVAAPSSP